MLRDANEDDLRDIVDIYNVAMTRRSSRSAVEPVTIDERRPWLAEHSAERYPLWVWEIEKRVAGWLSFQPFMPRSGFRGTAEISVYVHSDFHRHGVAGRLLTAAVERGLELEISCLIGLIPGNNPASLKLFERLGFQRWGLLPQMNHLAGKKRDIVIVGTNL